MVVLLSACSSSSQRAPVQEVGQGRGSSASYHIVEKGDTLFSIAWRYGLNYRDLANQNGINGNFVIYPGQKIYLRGSVPRPSVVRSTAAASSPAKSYPATPQPSKPMLTGRSKTPTSTPARPVLTSVSNGGVKWQWPASGRIIRNFSAQKSLSQGVDISGRLGEPVLAAAAGQVVFAGSGIHGYGNLLIIKHNERFLSAYAHNHRLMVKEQDVVKAGQKIAEIGNSGTDQYKLHFEVRLDGNPVDPMRYLPRR